MKKAVRLPFLILPLVLLLSQQTRAAEPKFQSGPARVSVVELYSSEGCSSCPPADAWMSALAEKPGLWTEFIPLAFHVHYWDGLGWKDPLAKREFTARQHAYASSWKTDTVYTPGLVLNGREWRNWRRSERPEASSEKAGMLEVYSDGPGNFQASYRPAGNGAGLQLHGALLGFGLASDVRAGENRGRKLRHDFVVLDWKKASLNPEADALTGQLRFAADEKAGRTAAVFWVTGPDGLAPLQAAGGYL